MSVCVGLLLGCAAMCEYPTALLAAGVASFAFLRLRRGEFALLFLGAVPGFLLVAGYDWAAFGSPISTGYGAHSVGFARQESRGFAGFTWPPSGDALYGLTISPYRGLFFLSPSLLLALPGYVYLRRRVNASGFLTILLLPWAFLIVIAMFAVWDGGSAIGPRYLIAAIPFLAVPVGVFIDCVRGWPTKLLTGALVLVSLANVFAQSIVNWTPPSGVSDPLFEFCIPELLRGYVLLNYGMVLLSPVGLEHSCLTLVPLLLIWIVWTRMCILQASRATAKLSLRSRAAALLIKNSG